MSLGPTVPLRTERVSQISSSNVLRSRVLSSYVLSRLPQTHLSVYRRERHQVGDILHRRSPLKEMYGFPHSQKDGPNHLGPPNSAKSLYAALAEARPGKMSTLAAFLRSLNA